MEGIHSKKALEAVLEAFFEYPVERTFLDVNPLKSVDAFLYKKCPIPVARLTLQSPIHTEAMKEGQIKATHILAKRCHREGNHLRSGLIYIQLACRQTTSENKISFDERLQILGEDATTQVCHLSA